MVDRPVGHGYHAREKMDFCDFGVPLAGWGARVNRRTDGQTDRHTARSARGHTRGYIYSPTNHIPRCVGSPHVPLTTSRETPGNAGKRREIPRYASGMPDNAQSAPLTLPKLCALSSQTAVPCRRRNNHRDYNSFVCRLIHVANVLAVAQDLHGKC